MILSSNAIKECVKEQWISIRPRFDERQLRPLGLRIHLAETILSPDANQTIDLSKEEPATPTFQRVDIRSSPLVLHPGDFVLGSSVESIRVHETLGCRLDGRSTLARLGVMVHCTSEIIDSIHQDHRSIVLEIRNIGPFKLKIPYLYPIGMIVFEKLTDPIDPALEQDQYRGQTEVTPPNLSFGTPRIRLT
jgi:dCTP deaminase